MEHAKKTVVVCESQPVTVEGVRRLLHDCSDLEVTGSATSLGAGMEIVRSQAPSLVLVDKAFGTQAVLDWIASLRMLGRSTVPVVWGITLGEAEALRMLQGGAMGVIRKTAAPALLLECLRTAAAGATWMEESIFQESERPARPGASNLTARERQVAELVRQGLRNKDIAGRLGIQTGTVKIHLKHIFEKTGVRGRYCLALNGLKERGAFSLAHA